MGLIDLVKITFSRLFEGKDTALAAYEFVVGEVCLSGDTYEACITNYYARMERTGKDPNLGVILEFMAGNSKRGYFVNEKGEVLCQVDGREDLGKLLEYDHVEYRVIFPDGTSHKEFLSLVDNL